jgi:LssY C-terminus
MSKFQNLCAALLTCAALLSAQTTTTAQNYNVQVSNAQPWTDTGLDLKAGDAVEISLVSAPARPSGCDTSASQTADLPLPSAPAGALLARLHSQGATPLQINLNQPLHLDEASHLYLGFNGAAAPACAVVSTFSIHVTPAGSTSTATDSQGTRGQHLKSQLGAAAQIFMSGQFGTGDSESSDNAAGATGSSASPLTVSSAPLDTDLRRNIDSLPRRVNDQFQNLGDMVNFVIVGNQKDVQAALDAASWHIADTSNKKSVLNAIEQTYENKDYLTMPMSTLYLFGRHQDFGYEMAEPIAMVASRHHFRIWKAPFSWQGKEVWVGAGTHDIGFAKDKRNGEVTHKIDPSVDGERDNIGSSLEKASKTKTVSYYLPLNPVQDAKNATGDGYHSDGRLIVIFLQ